MTTTNQVLNKSNRIELLALIQNYFSNNSQVEHVTPDGLVQKVVLEQGKSSNPLLNINCNVHYLCYGKFIVRHEDLAKYNDMITEEEMNLASGPMGVEKMYEDGRLQNISSKTNKNHKSSCFKQLCIDSMREDEKSVFLIHPKYVFGKEQEDDIKVNENVRIPPNSPFVYYFEIKKVLEYRRPTATNFRESVDNATFEREQGNVLYNSKKFKEALTVYRRGHLELMNIKELSTLRQDAVYSQRFDEELRKLNLNICRCLLALEQYDKLVEEIRKIISNKREEACDAELFFLRAKGNFAQTAHRLTLEDRLKRDIEVAISNCTASGTPIPTKYLDLKKDIFNYFERVKVDDSKSKQFAKNIFSNSNGIFDEEAEARLRKKKELSELEELERLHEEDVKLGRMPWFASDGSVFYE